MGCRMLYRVYAASADRDEQRPCRLSAGTHVYCGSGCGSLLGDVHVHIWFDGATFPIGVCSDGCVGAVIDLRSLPPAA